MPSAGNRSLILLVGSLLLASAPSRLLAAEAVVAGCVSEAGLSFICGAQKPEDLAHIPGTRWLVASGFDAGAGLKLVDTEARSLRFWYSGATQQIARDQSHYPDCAAAPDASVFNVHGIHLRADGGTHYTLYAVNHGGREAIEVFNVDVGGAQPLLQWRGCILLSEGLAANSVSATPDGTVLITVLARPGFSYADFVNGKPTGAVYMWRPGSPGFRLLPGTELPGNNGLETSPDGKQFYVVAFGLHSVFVYALANTARPLRQAVAPGFMPDNLHWDNGRLLLAGMVYDEPACGGTRKVVNGEADPMRCHRGFMVASLDPESMTFQILACAPPNVVHNGVSSAVVIGRELWLGSYQADRIAITAIRRSPPPCAWPRRQ